MQLLDFLNLKYCSRFEFFKWISSRLRTNEICIKLFLKFRTFSLSFKIGSIIQVMQFWSFPHKKWNSLQKFYEKKSHLHQWNLGRSIHKLFPKGFTSSPCCYERSLIKLKLKARRAFVSFCQILEGKSNKTRPIICWRVFGALDFRWNTRKSS